MYTGAYTNSPPHPIMEPTDFSDFDIDVVISSEEPRVLSEADYVRLSEILEGSNQPTDFYKKLEAEYYREVENAIGKSGFPT
jgi:hypothetical protein